MSIFPLEIFPGPLAQSVITSVWVGIVITGLFNTRLGWVLSGLVVNGYIVPLFIVNPWVAATVLIESLVTYSLAYFFSEFLSKKNFWASTFGRDRFFLIVILSVLVRLIFGKILLPFVGETFNTYIDLEFDYANNLYSVGLVIVALTANAIWKPGIKRAAIPFLVQFICTYIVIRYGLMVFTNFSISNLAFAYEDVSTFIDSSPKSYFILLTAAFMASKLNLRYGWDFNGILIPSLLALQWYQPQRIVLTFLEAWIVFYFGRKVLKMKIFKQTNLEGAPKIIIFYSISYAYKYIMTLICLYFSFELRITDYYAYGYLISTLIALKMHDKNVPFSLPRICIQASALAALAGVSIGFTFSKVSNGLLNLSSEVSTPYINEIRHTHLNYKEQMAFIKQAVYQELYNNKVTERNHMPQLLEAIQSIYSQGFDEKNLLSQAIRLNLEKMGYDILLNKDSHLLYLIPKKMGNHFGSFIFNLKTDSKLIVETTNMINEFKTFEASAYLFEKLQARALFIHQVEDYNIEGKENQYFPRFYQNIYANIFDSNILRVRALKNFLKEYIFDEDIKNSKSFVLARHRMPEGFKLNTPIEVVKNLEIKWFEHDSLTKKVVKKSSTTYQRVPMDIGFGQLLLSDQALYKFSNAWLSTNSSPSNLKTKIEIASLIREDSPYIAQSFDESFVPPTRGLTFLWDREIFSEIIKYKNSKKDILKSISQEEWRSYLRNKLSWLGYNVKFYKVKNIEHLLLYRKLNQKNTPPNYMGVYLFRMGKEQGYIIESPRPFYRSFTNEYALKLFLKLPADALLIAGAHPFSSADKSSNHWSKDNPATVFTAAHQALIRDAKDKILPVQVRGYYHREGYTYSQKPILMANLQGAWTEDHYDQLQTHLLNTINSKKNIVDIVDGRLVTAGFEHAETAQTPFSGQNLYRNFSLIWLPPDIRKLYGPVVDTKAEIRKFTTYDIKAFYTTLKDYLKDHPISRSWRVPTLFQKKLVTYLRSRDVISVKSLLSDTSGISFHIIRESVSGHLILSIRENNQTLALANLTANEEIKKLYIHQNSLSTKELEDFLENHYVWLLKRGL